MISDADKELLNSLESGASHKKMLELKFVGLCAKKDKTEADYVRISEQVKLGIDINCTDKLGFSGLHYATMRGCDNRLINLLLESKGYMNLADLGNAQISGIIHLALQGKITDKKLCETIFAKFFSYPGYGKILQYDLEYINTNFHNLDRTFVDIFISKLGAYITDIFPGIEAEKTLTKESLLKFDSDGNTPLIVATRECNTAMVVAILSAAKEAEILKEVLEVKNRSRYGATPLISTARDGNTAIVVAILSAAKEAEILKEVLEAKDQYGNTALISAAKDGNTAMVVAILSAAKEAGNLKKVLEANDQNGKTALMFAADKDDIEAFKAILSAAKEAGNLKKVLKAKDQFGNTALMLATNNPNIKAVKEFLSAAKEAGNLKEVGLNKALIWAASNRHTEAVQEIISAAKEAKNLKEVLVARDGSLNNALIFAVDKGDIEACKAILSAAQEAGVFKEVVEKRNTNHNNAIFLSRGNDEIAKLLFKHLYDINKLENLAMKLVKTHGASQIQGLGTTVNKYENKTAIGKFFYELFGNYGLKGDVKKALSNEVAKSYLEYKNTTRDGHKQIAKELKTVFDEAIKSVHTDNKTTLIVQAQTIRDKLFDQALEKFNTNKDVIINPKDINPDVRAKIDRKILEILKNPKAENKEYNADVVTRLIVKEVRSLDKTRFAEQALRKEHAPNQPVR